MQGPRHVPGGRVATSVAAAPADPDAPPYERFLSAVTLAQLSAWLPPTPCRVLDLSAGDPGVLEAIVAAGHDVVHAGSQPTSDHLAGDGHLVTVVATADTLDWVCDASVDAVVAEGCALSASLAAEVTVGDLHRVLRPGGRLLLCVDSLVSGLSRLADRGRWAELADVPAADVVLVPDDDGTVSRCFWPEELHAMLTDAGFDVEWVRPRTVLAEDTVTRALTVDGERLAALVATELALSADRQGESLGNRLVASARRR